MRKLSTASVVLILAVPGLLPGGDVVARAAPDVQVNNTTADVYPCTTQNEVTMAETGGILVAGWNDSSELDADSGIGYAVSTDGGDTWTDGGPLLPVGVTTANFSDPWIRAHDATGNFYFATNATAVGTNRYCDCCLHRRLAGGYASGLGGGDKRHSWHAAGGVTRQVGHGRR